MATRAHSAFAPLHAHFSGLEDLTAAGVAPRILLTLYPVDLTSYAPMLRAYYAEREIERISVNWVVESYRVLANCLNDAEQEITRRRYSKDESAEYWSFVDRGLETDATALAQEICDDIGDDHHLGTIRYQLRVLMRSMKLLSNWPVPSDEQAEVYGQRTFFEGLDRLCTYLGAPEGACALLQPQVAVPA